MTYDAAVSGTAVVGSGLIWDTVYERIREHNAVVLGGFVIGVTALQILQTCGPTR